MAPLAREIASPSVAPNYYAAPFSNLPAPPVVPATTPPVGFAVFDQAKGAPAYQPAVASAPVIAVSTASNGSNVAAENAIGGGPVQAAFRQPADIQLIATEALPAGEAASAAEAPHATVPAPSAPRTIPSVQSNSTTSSSEPPGSDARTYFPVTTPFMDDRAPGCPSCTGADGGCGTGGQNPSGGCGGPRECSCILQRLACCLCKPYPDCGNGCVDICHSWIFHEDECWLFSNHKCCQPWCPPSPYGGCATDGSQGCGCSGGNPAECVPPPDLYFTAEALVLTRDNQTSPQTIAETGGTPSLSTSDFPFTWEAGPKFVLGYRPTRCDAWEITYFGLLDYDSHNMLTGSGNLSLPGDVGALPGFGGADSITATYASTVHNAEFNYLWNHGCCVTWLMGFRYFQLTEDMDIDSLVLPSAASDYDIHTVNNMYGGQIGVRSGGRWRRFGWDATAKAAGFGNAIQDRQRLIGSDRMDVRDVYLQQEHWAFVGDVGINASYYICKHWSVRAGYNLMWVSGVALAPDQLDFTTTSTSGTNLNHNGNIFYQGVNAGFACRW